MDSVRNVFHAQLAAVMDSLLAAAVCEIAKIFESSMCGQQAEITRLLAELEQVQRRPRTKNQEDGMAAQGDERLSSNLLTEAGNCAIFYTGKEPDRENSSSGQKMVTESITSIKYESSLRDGSQPQLGSLLVQIPEESIDIPDQRTRPLNDPHVQVKVCQWHEAPPAEEHRSQQERNSPNRHCSPKTTTPPEQWSSVLDNTRGMIRGTSAYFQAETSKEEHDSLVFMAEKQEKHNYNQTSEHGNQKLEQSESGQHRPPPISPCGRGDDASSNRIRRNVFSDRDPVRLQSNSQSLKAHPPNLDGARPYACPYCSKSFSYPSHQRRHLLRHTGIRLHPCQFCDKSFLTPSELTVHTRTHTGERPFTCLQCGKRFARSGNLRAHQRDVHMRKRPFACAECGKRFAHRGNLRMHNHRVHHGDPSYVEQPDMAHNPS
ncbi:uncharacterized protein LOC144207385 [Stigmatopora nigra]